MPDYLFNDFENSILTTKANVQKIENILAKSLVSFLKEKFPWTDYPMNTYISDYSYTITVQAGEEFESRYCTFLKKINKNKIIYIILQPNMKEEPMVYIFNSINDFLGVRDNMEYDFLFTILDIDMSYLLCENFHNMICGIGDKCKDLSSAVSIPNGSVAKNTKS